jgi:hypothetical protein
MPTAPPTTRQRICGRWSVATPLHSRQRWITCGQPSSTADNVAEQRALERIGFTREGVLREAAFRDGAWRDAVIYALLRDDWQRH